MHSCRCITDTHIVAKDELLLSCFRFINMTQTMIQYDSFIIFKHIYFFLQKLL